MEEREKLWIYITQRERNVASTDIFKGYIFMTARSNARHRYVDRLTKKQRDAINFIKMLDDGEFIDNVGGKTTSVRWGDLVPQITIYILDC